MNFMFPDQTPPAYIAVSSDDNKVNPQNSVVFMMRCVLKNVLSPFMCILLVDMVGDYSTFPYHRIRYWMIWQNG